MWKDSETQVDFLDFDYLTNILIDIVNNENLSPSSIGVYGDWGSGKSSLMQMSIDELAKGPNILCIKFNGWLFEGYEDTKTALIGTILDEISNKRTLGSKAKDIIVRLYKNTDKLKLASKAIKYGIDFFVTGGIGTITDITLSNIISKVKENSSGITDETINDVLQQEFKSKEIRENIKTFQNDFIKLLDETKIEKLVIFIDEIDRCNANSILETLEAIRLFLFVNKTSFVIGADERHITYAVRKKYSEIEGKQIDIGKEYLEKMIQYPIRIPQLDKRGVEFYILCLLFQDELDANEFNEILKFIKDEKIKNFIEFELTFTSLNKSLPEIAKKCKDTISLAKQLSSVLATHLNGNPRHCKRFLNSLSMREKMAKYRAISLERKTLAKLMLLEYFKTDLYKKTAQLQALEKGKPKELELIENNKWDETENLKLWKDDNWVSEWIKLEPKLNNIDLRPYFYFSRESLVTKFNLREQNLSIEAEKALEELLSGSDIQRNNALNKVTSISDFEAIIIFDKIKEHILSNPKIELKSLRSLLDWGSSRDILITNTINCLKEIKGDKINISMIPRVKEFMDKTGKKVEITEIANQWNTENPKLRKAIEKDF